MKRGEGDIQPERLAEFQVVAKKFYAFRRKFIQFPQVLNTFQRAAGQSARFMLHSGAYFSFLLLCFFRYCISGSGRSV